MNHCLHNTIGVGLFGVVVHVHAVGKKADVDIVYTFYRTDGLFDMRRAGRARHPRYVEFLFHIFSFPSFVTENCFADIGNEITNAAYFEVFSARA